MTDIEYTPITAHLRKAEWATPQGTRFLCEIEHACGHWEPTLAPHHISVNRPLLTKEAGQDCLKCQNRATQRARRQARKGANRT